MSISSLIGQMVLGLGAFGFAVLMTKPLSELFRHSDVFLMALSQVKVLLPLGIATFLIGLIGFFFFIRFLKSLGVEQFIREEGPQSHQIKQGTPTGGGILFISLWAVMSILCVYLLPLFPPLKLYYGHAPLAPEGLPFYGSSPYFYAPLGVSVLLMGLGMWDDLAKVLKKQNKGLGARAKLVVQAGIGLLFGLIMAFVLGDTTVNVFGHGVTLTTWQYLLYGWSRRTGGGEHLLHFSYF
jgi:phospho-N-acetylmuramoyl-pentapeptide-transferase